MNVVYDGSIEGLLTAVFICFRDKLKRAKIISQDRFHPGFFEEELMVITDPVLAERVLTGVKKKAGKQFNQFFYALHNDRDDNAQVVLDYVRYVFSGGNGKARDYSNPAVLTVSKNAKMISREKHRMEAFVRFRLTKDDIYFASIEPDFDVIPLIKKHFYNRYKDQKWMIYDLKRNYGIYYDLKKVVANEIIFNEDKNEILRSKKHIYTAQELEFQKLWANYFKHTNIESRKNTKLHVRHVPKRYWRYLSEKTINIDEG